MVAFFLLAVALQGGTPTVSGAHCTATLIADTPSVTPGGKFRVGVLFKMDPHWHIYWTNPGDSGLATSVKWAEAPGLAFGKLQWPAPRRFTGGGAVGYGYEGSTVLFTEARVAEDAKIGSKVRIEADVSWLACEEACIPGGGRVSLELPVAKSPGVGGSPGRKQIDAVSGSVPTHLGGATARKSANGYLLTLPLDAATAKSAYFFPSDGEVVSHGADQPKSRTGQLTLTLPKSEYATREPEALVGVVVVTGQDTKVRAYHVSAELTG